VIAVASANSIEMLRHLVSFDTTSRNSNLDLIGFIRDRLAEQGVESELCFDDRGEKANLLARIGPETEGGILLAGHTDVVPVDGQDWITDPFAPVEKEGRIYGRGTADMKGFLAVILARVPAALARGLKKPLFLAFTYDEEVGCFGARRLMPRLDTLTVKPAGCIVGEPTEMKVITGHKGMKGVRCKVRGAECHSALAPEGVSAVEIAAELIARLRAQAREFRNNGPFDRRFEPPHTTVHTGIVEGGTAMNIVARDCRFEFDIRALPGDDAEAILREIREFAERHLLPDMRAVSAEAGIVWETIAEFPGLATGEEEAITVLAKTLARTNATGKVSFGTEAGLYHETQIPTVVCGPGSILQAHKPDEFVELDQIRLCEAFIDRLIERLAAA
jgi:acetylornithine deacetylase